MQQIESSTGNPGEDRGRTLIGGVGYRWQGDLSFGLAVSDALAARNLPPYVEVADLGYGAIYVAQDVADLHPAIERLVLVAGTVRDRQPGRLYEFLWDGTSPDDEMTQALIREAGAGVVHVDHVLAVGAFLDALPEQVLIFEAEPTDHRQGEALSQVIAPLVTVAADRILRAVGIATIHDIHPPERRQP